MRSLMFVLAPLLVACSVDSPETTMTPGQRVEVQNRLASNRLASNRLASNRLASNRLASNSIGTNLLANMDTAQLLESAAGRDVYSYLISCALGFETTVMADLSYLPEAPLGESCNDAANQESDCRPADTDCTNPGSNGENCPNYTCTDGVCTFFGNLGLAPRWETHRLSNAGRGWVSACMFARVNANNVAEAISLRGQNDAIAVGETEAEDFNLEEGAFYGNLFVDDPNANVSPDWNACVGRDKALNPSAGGLDNRSCTTPDPMNLGYTLCGFKYTGECQDHGGAPTPYACKSVDTVTVGTTSYDQYDDCFDSEGSGRWVKSFRSREVLTVYVSNL